MSLEVAAIVFGVIFAAEVPDKTMIAIVLMAARMTPVWVWLGASCAFVAHSALAVAAGRALALAPRLPVEVAVSCLFAAGALWLLLVPERREVRSGELASTRALEAPTSKPLRVFATAFGVIALGEFGDLTQVLTLDFAARYRDWAAVFVGSALGLAAITGVGTLVGTKLVRRAPLGLVRRVSGAILAGFAVFSALSAARV
jgi:putative Ca2+/H+ antiporter (TMEM165/GDT1 family)